MNLQTRENGPDFIIGGAQKAGTTSLHHMLHHHPALHLIQGEINYWTIDDPAERSHFNTAFRMRPPRWVSVANYEQYLRKRRPADVLLGEDSTLYLSSAQAAERIAAHYPDMKLIFLLRHPSKRAYSHYWHQVVRSRAYLSFEEWLDCDPNLIRRGLYGQHLDVYLKLFDRSQLRVYLFEQFIDQMPQVVAELCSFLGVEPFEDFDRINTHENRATVRRNIDLNMRYNRFLYRLQSQVGTRGRLLMKLLDSVHNRINPINSSSYPKMSSAMRAQLDAIFADDIAHLKTLFAGEIPFEYWD